MKTLLVVKQVIERKNVGTIPNLIGDAIFLIFWSEIPQ